MKSKLFVVEPKDYARIAVVGDIHGDYHTLVGLPGLVNFDVDLLVFLGDYADRGAFGVETIRAVAALREEFPNYIIALKGNHEDYTEDGEPTFEPSMLIAEAEKKTGSWKRFFQDEFKPFIDSLHLAALVPVNTFFLHGGVSSGLTRPEDLEMPSRELELDVLWSDPFDGMGERSNPRGEGVEFGTDISASVCAALGVKQIVRSHQPTLAATGPFLTHGGRVVTVQATYVYGGVPFVYLLDLASTGKNNYQIIPV